MTTKWQLEIDINKLNRKVAYQKKKVEDAENDLKGYLGKNTELVKETRVANRSITLLRMERDEFGKQKSSLHHDLQASEEIVEKLLGDVQRLSDKVTSKHQAIGSLKDRTIKLEKANREQDVISKADQAHIDALDVQNIAYLNTLNHYRQNQLDALAVIELGLFLFYPEIYKQKLKNQIDPTDPQPRLFLRMFDILNKTEG